MSILSLAVAKNRNVADQVVSRKVGLGLRLPYKVYASSYMGLNSSEYTITSAPTAAASVQPVTALPGQQVSVDGAGFNVGAGFYIRWKEPNGEPIGTGAAEGFGKLRSTTAVIPQSPAGDYQIYITDDRNKTAVVPFTIVSPPQK